MILEYSKAIKFNKKKIKVQPINHIIFLDQALLQKIPFNSNV